MRKIIPYIEAGIPRIACCILVIIICIVLSAFENKDHSPEAPIGSFETIDYNTNWDISINQNPSQITELPSILSCDPSDVIVMKNTLPENLSDGMTLLLRSSLEDAFIYVDKKLRASYATENFESMTYYIPSAYIVVPLNEEDAGKEIEVHLKVKVSGVINEITLGYGNTPWFKIFKENYLIASISIFIIFLGIIVSVAYCFIRKRFKVPVAIFYLGLLMNITGIWLISESKLRQFIFTRPSLTSIFSYLSVELIGIFALLYFDEIQHKIHHKIYLIMECIMTFQLLLNITLDFTGILCFYETLFLSHLWLALGIFFVVLNIILDIIHKRASKYKIVIIGMGIFLLFGIMEIIHFYLHSPNTFGPSISIGLIILLLMNSIQIFSDVLKKFEETQLKKQKAWINTIETIAGAIDAKDEYTGGHSERVANYAGLLAQEMAKDYHFSKEDILRIRYIGLMHDIGKIGVTDDILNKAESLTSEEFSLMKKHVEIGSSLMEQVGANTEGLLDGIRHHHERYDGLGYPDGLKGTEIPLIARILCIADSYDAMTSNRIYHRRLSDTDVKQEILDASGKQFDPALTKYFVRLIERGDISPHLESLEAVHNHRQMLRSIVLEECLKKAEATGTNAIVNPSHVRFACYIMKLSEKNKQNFEVFFIKPKVKIQGSYHEFLNQIIHKYIRTKDINIRYTETKNLIVLFGRTDDEIQNIMSEISQNVSIECLSSESDTLS